MMKTKVRGLSRKCREMVSRIESGTQVFPLPHRGLNYWHFHLPWRRDFLDSRATLQSVRRLCLQTLIDRAQHLISLAPTDQKTRVVVAIELSNLWQSQLIVFFEEDYFGDFFARNTDAPHWTIDPKMASREWNLQLPADFSERCSLGHWEGEEGRLQRRYFVFQLDW